MSEQTTLITAGWLVTGAGVDDRVIEDGAVAVRDGQVLELGSASAMLARHPQARRLGGPADALIPGLVNAHHHSHGASHLQQGVADDVLEPWLLALTRQRETDRRLAVLLSAARQLRAGVTTCVDVVSGGGSAREFADLVDVVSHAYDESGMRARVAPGFSSRSLLVHGAGEDQRFIASLPAADRALAESLLPAPGRLDDDDYMALMEERIRARAADARVALWFGPPGPQWVSERLLQRVAEAAERLDTRIQTHVSESFYEKLAGQRAHGCDTVLHLDRLGVLGPRFTLAHGVWLTQAELEVLARTGAAVSHNPGSNLRLRAGIAPLASMLQAGVTVALGMDGTTMDDEEDAFAEMRLALRLAGSPRIDAWAPAPRDLFAMATTGGARLLGAADGHGRIAPGFAADLVLLDTSRLRRPWLAPDANPLDLLVLRARAGDVHTVLVDGEVVLDNRRPTRFDEAVVARELAERLSRAAPGLPHWDRINARLVPHLRRWYSSWPLPALEPWTMRDSRR